MELNWTTFVLEVINFLILVWILKRFLYKPVLGAIAQRKAAIDKTLSDAKAMQGDAHALEQQYQHRVADWEREKETLRRRLVEEINAQRAQMMTALETSLGQEREKTRVLEQRRLEELQNRAEEAATSEGVQFTARLLSRAACPELEARLVALVLEDLPLLSDERLQAIRAACREGQCRANVISAYSLPAELRSAIIQKLKATTQHSIAVEFAEDGRLLAGLRISVGPWVLRANLQDELKFFADSVRHDSRKQ